jgi:hypothetical protein
MFRSAHTRYRAFAITLATIALTASFTIAGI